MSIIASAESSCESYSWVNVCHSGLSFLIWKMMSLYLTPFGLFFLGMDDPDNFGSMVSAFRFICFLLLFPYGTVTVGCSGPLMISFWVSVVWGPCPPRTPVSPAQGPGELPSPWDTIHWLWDNGILSQVHVFFFSLILFIMLKTFGASWIWSFTTPEFWGNLSLLSL